ncbi:hypothetical protein L596_022774 [Steinernema carpocapsae]|uniref:Uncharacterized protein n=2 Tax=Steinernema carpocapsae TaxID=34508 RepID=A0A4U5MMS3_STECR|nr:hypothetical protein L596_022774 [Steinernema carpocapsae]
MHHRLSDHRVMRNPGRLRLSISATSFKPSFLPAHDWFLRISDGLTEPDSPSSRFLSNNEDLRPPRGFLRRLQRFLVPSVRRRMRMPASSTSSRLQLRSSTGCGGGSGYAQPPPQYIPPPPPASGYAAPPVIPSVPTLPIPAPTYNQGPPPPAYNQGPPPLAPSYNQGPPPAVIPSVPTVPVPAPTYNQGPVIPATNTEPLPAAGGYVGPAHPPQGNGYATGGK